MENFAWLCEVRGLIYAKRTGSPSYGGSFMAVYFDDFKTIAHRQSGQWVLANRTFPLDFSGGVYGMMKALGY